ncbi:type IV secretory system conjugative DNA transfer family protein [Pannonibacter phragmitetus]|uniref:type IV secretory system conjugative DNA transfer family protein n=1 Tax=Pannonibacter phragmitetus TaxID=121719 RepID=UPI0032B60A71
MQHDDLRAANRHLGKSDREAAGVLSAAQRHTHFLDSPRMTAVLGRSDFRFADLKARTTTVFLVLPPDRLATLAEFERDLIRERTMAGLAAARARGRKGGRKFALTKAQVRLAQAAMAQRDTSVSNLCKELGIERVTLYRYVGPNGELRNYGKRVLGLA